MGCSLKAIDDDEEDFYAFCKKVKVSPRELKGCYCVEYELAISLHNNKKFTGDRLLKGVALMMALRDLDREALEESAEYKKYLELKAKFEPAA